MMPGHEVYKFYPYKFKLLSTIGCQFIYLNYGLLFILPNVGLIDMTYLLGTTSVIASNGITARGIAYTIGALSCELN